MSLAALHFWQTRSTKARLARVINASAGLLLGVWSPDRGGKAAAGVLAVVTILATAASTHTPHRALTVAEADRPTRLGALRPQPVNLALLAPANVAAAPLIYQQ